MRAVVVMFDTLSRTYLPPYGNDWVHAPNFRRLAENSVTFDNCYAGSMPCMPARRELHTGRYNFLHRSWGQLEVFDESVPEMLDASGVYTHLVTDHKHYWHDMGATYHSRFTSHEFVRGQAGDMWIPEVDNLRASGGIGNGTRRAAAAQHKINVKHMATEDKHSQTIVFDRGLDFLRTNSDASDWFLQIETFDPHEPFFTYDHYRDLYPREAEASDLALYSPVWQEPEQIEDIRRQYAALLSQCDASLGRVLDAFDELEMWDDTLLLVCTDHGFLLGEHGWWGKGVQPWYGEVIHTPLFVWDPRVGTRGTRCDELVQTIDIAPTLLDVFGAPPTDLMMGKPLRTVMTGVERGHEWGLFGSFGAHVNVTDGRYVYMRACVDDRNVPLNEYTLSAWRFGPRNNPDLGAVELTEPREEAGDTRTMRLPLSRADPGIFGLNSAIYGTQLFDLVEDPDQQRPLVNDELELRMAELLVTGMRSACAPTEQFERLGLPADGPVTTEHLLARAQHSRVLATALTADGANRRYGLHTPVRELLAHKATRLAAATHLVAPRDDDPLTPLQHLVMDDGVLPIENVEDFAARLADLA